MAKAIAQQLGQYGGVLRFPNQEFDLKDGDKCPSWAVPSEGVVLEHDDNQGDDHDAIMRQTRIIQAVEKLDHKNDEQWTTGGKPKVKAVEEILGFDISSEELKAACPDVTRN